LESPRAALSERETKKKTQLSNWAKKGGRKKVYKTGKTNRGGEGRVGGSRYKVRRQGGKKVENLKETRTEGEKRSEKGTCSSRGQFTRTRGASKKRLNETPVTQKGWWASKACWNKDGWARAVKDGGGS